MEEKGKALFRPNNKNEEIGMLACMMHVAYMHGDDGDSRVLGPHPEQMIPIRLRQQIHKMFTSISPLLPLYCLASFSFHLIHLFKIPFVSL